MHKSIYSLVLADDVVAAVDRMAYQLHTSRSNLINQILAERLSCITPEMRMQAVFARMEELAGSFRVLEQTSAHMLSLQSQLDYKYKPTVQYYVELYRIPKNGEDGRLRVQLRTQNQTLIAVLDDFFRLWAALEEHYIPAAAGTVYRVSPGRLERTIRNPGVEEDALGELIGRYVRLFDKYLKAYFAGIAHPKETAARLESAFREEAQKLDKII
jgi:predicted transcriptional regulator